MKTEYQILVETRADDDGMAAMSKKVCGPNVLPAEQHF